MFTSFDENEKETNIIKLISKDMPQVSRFYMRYVDLTATLIF